MATQVKLVDDADAPASPWYALPADTVAQHFDVEPASGLAVEEARERLSSHGANVLATTERETRLHAFVRQYQDFMQILLVTAAVINQIVTGEWGTTLLLVVLTVFNAVLGLRGESKAEASLAALAQMLKSVARVRRDGLAIEVDASELVPGDIVLFEAGDRVPADGRLVIAATLEIEEAALTGESAPTLKTTEPMPTTDAPVGDRLCMAFMNTSVTRGRGEMIVTSTGMGTEIGRVAGLLAQTTSDKTPLQKQLDGLTILIAGIAGIAFALILVLGLRRDDSFEQLFITGVTLAIAAIPTGLPAVVTTLYSMGTRVLASHNAIVKRLPSVETLGSVSAICSDKTGTLTLNKMTARELTVPGQNRFRVTGEGYSTEGQFLQQGGDKVDLDAVLLPMALCTDARLDGEQLIGDPTEGALIVLAAKGGIDIEGARGAHPRVAEVPFDSEYKFMATFHEMVDASGQPKIRAFVKGAPDVLISRAGTFLASDGTLGPITAENRHLATDENDRMAASGERVMVVARRDFDPSSFDVRAASLLPLIDDLTLLAMVGIVDPPRSEARDAIAMCKSAGIQVRMITGDHPVTAAAIARELGIEGTALSGAEFSAMSDEVLSGKLNEIGVVARVAPEDKIRLVSLLQQQGNVVAMTGDGVNDAPALKKADIGVAMGITGTEVSREAAVMVLTDDNFATIVRAIEYGRGLYDNLSKYIRFQLASLVAFIGTFLGAAIFSIADGVPFDPLMVLWLNFAITVPLALALGFDSPSEGLMERKPRPMEQPVISAKQWVRIVLLGTVIAAGTLLVQANSDAVQSVAMAATVFSLFNIFVGLSSRDETATAFNAAIFADRRQVGLYGLALGLTVLATELGFLQRILGTTSMTGAEWVVCIAVGASVLLVDEVVKFFMRLKRNRASVTHQAEPVRVPASTA